MVLKLLRNAVGSPVVFIDWLTRPNPLQRSEEAQAQVELATRHLTLYQLYACPFCIKTRRALRRLNLPIETRNVSSGSPHREELLEGGGRVQVPCLKISDQGQDLWMYESGDIIHYLEQRFGEA